MRAGEPLVSGLVGYEDTVLPQIENAVLAGHEWAAALARLDRILEVATRAWAA